MRTGYKKKIKRISNSLHIRHPLLKNIAYYLGYILIFLFCHLCVLSIVTFFHFLLDHRMRTVEDWLFRNGWEVIVVSKLIALYLIMKFINLNANVRYPIRKFFQKGWIYPHKYIFVSILFLLIFTIYLGQPRFTGNGLKYLDFQLVSFFGIFVFYFVDYFIFSYLKNYFPLKRGIEHWAFAAFFILVFFFISKAAISYEKGLHFFFLCNMMMCVYLGELNGRGWLMPTLYIVFVVAPLSTFFGINHIWGNLYATIEFSQSLPKYLVVALMILAAIYLYISYQKKLTGR